MTAFAGEYLFDAREFRTEDKARLVEEVVAMTKRRFALVRGLVSSEPWDFLAAVEIGPDRMHHALLAHHDPRHPKHDPASPFRDALREYYQLLDQEIAALLSDLPSRTRVLVVSDHGVQRLEGGIALNEWLIAQGVPRPQGGPGSSQERAWTTSSGRASSIGRAPSPGERAGTTAGSS